MQQSYASLGYNCEIAYQFRRVMGHDVSSYFNWCYGKPTSIAHMIERNFHQPFEYDMISSDGIMIWERKYDILYHGDVFNKSNQGKDKAAKDFFYRNLREKIEFLIVKWNYIVNSEINMIYFLKLRQDSESVGIPRDIAILVRDAILQSYPHHQFKIVAVMSLEQGMIEENWGEPLIYNRYIAQFAPDHDPEAGNSEEWNRIFHEFPLVHNLDN